MNSRDLILNRIRQVCVPDPTPLPNIPFFHQDGINLVEKFKKSFVEMGGTLLPEQGEDPCQAVKEKLKEAKNICSVVPEIKGDYEITHDTAPNRLHDIDYAVVRASFGIAETGSVCLTETDLVVNTLGYLPQHLIVLLDPDQIVENIHDAYARPEWKEHHYACLHSGPSATADIEGVLIHGAQGVRSLSIAFVKP